MNKLNGLLIPLVALSVVLSASALIVGAANLAGSGTTTVMTAAPAAAHRAAAPVKDVRVVMHDPGCHWFQTKNGGIARTMNVKGPMTLSNLDEAALKVAGANGVQTEPIGAALRLSPGTYHITMVGQKSDDNHLLLRVI